MDKLTLKLALAPSNPVVPLGASVYLDDVCVFSSNHVDAPVDLAHEFDDVPGAHSLKISLTGKLPEHTRVNGNEILEDAVLSLTSISIDGQDLTKMLWFKSVYEHDFNGTGDTTQDKFYGTLGCNGTVTLNFEGPFFIWFLENS